jgi:hypothetical protein
MFSSSRGARATNSGHPRATGRGRHVETDLGPCSSIWCAIGNSFASGCGGVSCQMGRRLCMTPATVTQSYDIASQIANPSSAPSATAVP